MEGIDEMMLLVRVCSESDGNEESRIRDTATGADRIPMIDEEPMEGVRSLGKGHT